MHLVILAAGRGSRLGPDALERPKSLVQVGDRPYLAYQLTSFARYPLERKIIVGGFGIGELADFLVASGRGDYELLENPDYDKGNLYSLATARARLDGDFIVFNADHFYSPENYARILSIKNSEITIFCDTDRALTDDDMKVRSVSDGAGRARLVDMAKTLAVYEAGYVGVTYVPAARSQRYWQAFDETARSVGDKANVESVLNRLAESGEAVRLADISGSWWTEIDTPEDLEKARVRILSALTENGHDGE